MKELISSVFCISWYVMICAAFSSYAGVVEATSPVFALSLKHDGVRQRAGAETLTYYRYPLHQSLTSNSNFSLELV